MGPVEGARGSGEIIARRAAGDVDISRGVSRDIPDLVLAASAQIRGPADSGDSAGRGTGRREADRVPADRVARGGRRENFL